MRKLTCLAILLWSALLCTAQQSVLRLNLEKGKSYKQITDSKTTIVQDLGGQKMTMEIAVTGTLSFLVKSVTDSGYHMDARFETLTMSMKTFQGAMNFSSENDDSSDIFSSILREMKDKPFTVTMAGSGEITQVGDVGKLWEAAINQFSQLSEMQKDQIKAQMLNSYGDKALKGNIEMVTALFPTHAVRVGDKWTVDTNLESGMSAKVTSEYELVKMTSEHIFLKGVSRIETADKDAYIESNGMPMKYNLKGNMSSEIRVDRQTGWINEAKINQEISGDAQIKDNPQVPGGMTIPMTMTSVIVITD